MSTAVYDYFLSKLSGQNVTGLGFTMIVEDAVNVTLKASDYPYIRYTMLPAESAQREVGRDGMQQYPGLIRYDLWYQRRENTAQAARVAGDSLVELLLDPGSRLYITGNNQIVTETAWAEQPRLLDNGFNLPVFVRYNNYVHR